MNAYDFGGLYSTKQGSVTTYTTTAGAADSLSQQLITMGTPVTITPFSGDSARVTFGQPDDKQSGSLDFTFDADCASLVCADTSEKVPKHYQISLCQKADYKLLYGCVTWGDPDNVAVWGADTNPPPE